MKFKNLTYNKVIALGIPALLMALLIAAALSVNNAQAQVPGDDDPGPGNVRTGVDLNKAEYSEPYPCNGDEPVAPGTPESVDDGHYAAFDAFWDYNKRELSNNFCPPQVVHREEEDEDTGETYEVTTRSASGIGIDIRKTVFSIPDSHKAEIVNSASPGNGQISRHIYRFLPNISSDVWWLKADDDTTLVMGFSAGLLKDEHWQAPPGGKAVQYEFEARERPTCPDPNEEAHFYVFQDSDMSVDTAKWNSSKPDETELGLNPGEYEHYNWVFTCPGTYRVQIQFKGHVNPNGPLAGIGSDVTTETSVARLYTFHVGPADDLGVSVTPETQDVAASATSASFTVKATNAGPDDSHDAEVQIYLPEGLEYVPDSSHTGVTYANGVIAWDLGELAPTVSSTTPTLNFSASIDRTKASGTVTVRAEIRNVASGDLDSNSANNVSFAAVRLSSQAVHPPIFVAKREIEEFASSFERVGEPVMAFSPELRTLSYSLSGRGHRKFQVVGNGQIVVANNVELEYEKQWSYWLELTATDDGGNSDSILVIIRVINVEGPKVRFWLQYTNNLDPPADPMNPESGDTVEIHAKLHNLPAGVSLGSCVWEWGDGGTSSSCSTPYFNIEPRGRSVPTTYTVKVEKSDESLVTVGAYTINWRPES